MLRDHFSHRDMSNPPTPYKRSSNRGVNSVYKSGSLLISSKGLGWKSWKRRWFVLTEASLVFFKSDPNSVYKGNESNLALGGIDLNNLGRVLVRSDKKLLTVLFPDGRAFTLKAETAEDLEEWKASLEKAISAAPNADLMMGQSGIFKNDSIDAGDGPTDTARSKKPVKSMVIGRPILLALEDIDGSPSFLEKALCFIEQYGVRVEGILRQSADVDEVEKRVRDYEQGKTLFGADEDAHVIGDCIKHVLRELPSLPVPTPCCAALVDAQRTEDRESQVLSMRAAVAETFPEPNRRLLQRVLRMMQTVAAHATENRMTASAVAACMAPLLLKPLMTGECGFEDESDFSGDNSAQLLAAAAAANNAQAIITILLEEYDNIFEDEGLPKLQILQDSSAREDDRLSHASSDGEVLQAHEENPHDADKNNDKTHLSEDPERVLSGSMSGSSGNEGSDIYDNKVLDDEEYEEEFNKKARRNHVDPSNILSRSVNFRNSREIRDGHIEKKSLNSSTIGIGHLPWKKYSPVETPKIGNGSSVSTNLNKSVSTPSGANIKRSSIWGLSATKRTTMPQSQDSYGEEELLIQRLEATRNELRNKIAKEAKGNAALQQSLERRKHALHERRLVLEQDVARLQEQLRAERELRTSLEAGLTVSSSQFTLSHNLDSKTRVEIEEIAAAEEDVARLKQRVAELHAQLSQQRQRHGSPLPVVHESYRRGNGQQNNSHLQGSSYQESMPNIEGQNRNDQTSGLEQLVMQQRTALQEAKVHEALKSEKERGWNIRRQALASEQDSLISSDWRASRPPTVPVPNGKQQVPWRQRHESSTSNPSSRQLYVNPFAHAPAEVVVSSSGASDCDSNDLGPLSAGKYLVDIETPSSTMSDRHAAASSALAELTTRLNFFKERRSLLVEQLQNLDSTLTPSLVDGHGFMYSSSPPWTRPG